MADPARRQTIIIGDCAKSAWQHRRKVKFGAPPRRRCRVAQAACSVSAGQRLANQCAKAPPKLRRRMSIRRTAHFRLPLCAGFDKNTPALERRRRGRHAAEGQQLGVAPRPRRGDDSMQEDVIPQRFTPLSEIEPGRHFRNRRNPCRHPASGGVKIIMQAASPAGNGDW